MSTRVKKFLSTLRRVRKIGDKVRRDYILKCGQCAKNIIKGNVPLTNRQIKNLRRRRYDLRALSCEKNFTASEKKDSAE